MAISGSLEVTSNGVSTAQRVTVASLANVPAILQNNFGMTNIASITAVKVGTVTSAGAWSGSRAGSTARARLWQDIPFEETALGKALARGDIDPLNPGG